MKQKTRNNLLESEPAYLEMVGKGNLLISLAVRLQSLRDRINQNFVY